MRTIAIINQKGGCGKTTTAINMAASLARRKKRVLLIDLDPQGHASLGLNVKPENVTKGMTEVLTQGMALEDVLCEAIIPGLDLAPANITLSAAEPLLSNVPKKEQRLLSAIGSLNGTYSYVIIDSPPSLGLLTFNALRACSEAIVPIEMSFFSLHGLAKLSEIIDVVGRHTGHKVTVRALATMVNRRARFTQEVLGEIQRHFEGRFFKTHIRNNVRLREAVSHGVPISEYDSGANGAVDYAAMAEEVLTLEEKHQTDAVKLAKPAFHRPVPDVLASEAERYLGPMRVDEIMADQHKSPVGKSGSSV